ncbi:MAG: glycosyltransferase [Desulfobacteraceae bacterium]|nr:MAG: glycosyltransferase [Desulfobacteraceae bacterium]
MRILYAVSLFSGLKKSVRQGSWEPSGAPTIYKIIERLDQAEDEVDFVFSAKEKDEEEARGAKRITIKGLRSPVWLLPYGNGAKRFGLGRLSRELRQAMFLLRLQRVRRYDLCYFNNGNLLVAALFAFLGIGRVVMRIMGVYPVMKRVVSSPRGIGDRVERAAYRAPYAHVICTQDGSGGEWFLEKALKENVTRDLWINGVDWEEKRLDEPREIRVELGLAPDRPVILFLGKLERAKGCREFLEAVIQLGRARRDFQAVMVGRGPESETLKRMAAESGLKEEVVFVPFVAHKEIWKWYKAADIYVSLNKLGSLSNANLEAMRYGTCMVMLRSDPVNHVDEATDHLLRDGCAIRISRDNTVDDLVKALSHLLDNPEVISATARKVKSASRDLIPTWESRIEREIRCLQGIAASLS